MLLGSEVRGATTTEFGDPVEIEGSEFDTSMTIQLSKDGRKFRATVRIGFDTAECSGLIGSDLKVISDKCRLPTYWNSEVNRLTGKFPHFVLNEEGKCVVFRSNIGFSECYGDLASKVNFYYPTDIVEEKNRQELAKNFEGKKRQVLASNASEKSAAGKDSQSLQRENARLKKQSPSPPKQVAPQPSPPSKSSAEKEVETLRKEIARLKK